MKNVSKAGAGLLTWVVAIVKYHGVAKNVEPLKLKVAKMEKEQARSEAELEQQQHARSEKFSLFLLLDVFEGVYEAVCKRVCLKKSSFSQ